MTSTASSGPHRPTIDQRHVVVRNIDRVDAELIEQLAPIGTATVHEALGKRGFIGAEITPIQQGARIAGSAVTVLVQPGDNLMVHAAIEVCRPGDVLVVANTAPSAHGIFGDMLATTLMARGVRGLIIDAGVRDTLDLRQMGFPVWSRWVSCQGPVRIHPGSVNVPVSIGGVIIEPGDVVTADDDGVVVVPRNEAAAALEGANQRLGRETATRQRLSDGELGVDIYDLRQQIADLGVEYI